MLHQIRGKGPEHPAQVRVPTALQNGPPSFAKSMWRVRVSVGIARDVMLPVGGHPELKRTLRGHAAQDAQSHPHPGHTFKTPMAEQAVKADGQPKHGHTIKDHQQHQIRPRHDLAPQSRDGERNRSRVGRKWSRGRGGSLLLLVS